MAIRSARNVEKQKKKSPPGRPAHEGDAYPGQHLAVRRRLKKMSGKARAAKAKAAG